MSNQNKYLEDILHCAENENSNIFIKASAGAGKTFTLCKIADTIPKHKKCIFLAFNKSIAEELRERLPYNIEVSTIHAKAYGILRQNIKMNTELSEYKNFGYCRFTVKRKFQDKKKENAHFFTISNAISFLKSNNLRPTNENIKSICDSYGLDLNKDHVEDVKAVFNKIEMTEKNLNKPNPIKIDYTDMLYLCVNKVDNNLYPKYDYVMVDEVQDLSELQQKIVLNLVKQDGRLIAVGDDKQAINQFNGSSLKTFEVFQNRPNTKIFTLPVTYRCARKIVELANEIFPDQTVCKEGAEEGSVKQGDFRDAQTGDMIICRNNKPLILVWLELIKLGKKSNIMGKDFGTSLKNLVSKLNNVRDIAVLLENKAKDLKELGIGNPYNSNAYQALKEKTEIIEILYYNFGSFLEVEKKIEEIFSNTVKGITLATIHKSKGLEADRVYILNWELIPSKYAITEEQLYSEKCLQYVAVTRPKKELIFTNIDL